MFVKPNKYVIEALLFLSYMFFGMSWQASTIFLPNIMEEMQVTQLSRGSWISNVVAIAKIIGTFIAATILTKFGTKKAVTLSLFLMALGIFTGFASNFTLLLIIRFLVGLGSSLIVVFFAPLVFELFEAKERPIVNGMNSVALNVGTAIVAFSITGLLSVFNHSWQTILIVISSGSMIVFVLWLIFGANTTAPEHTTKKTYTILDGLKEPFNWLLAFTYSGTLSFYLILLTFYIYAGIASTKYFMALGILGTIAGIIIAQKSHNRLPLLRLSGLIQILAILGIHSQAWGWTNNSNIVFFSSIIAGFFIFLPMTSLVLLAQERKGATKESISVTFSLFWSLSYIVGTFAPLIFGKLVDINNNFTIPFIFSTIIASTFLIGSLLLKEIKN